MINTKELEERLDNVLNIVSVYQQINSTQFKKKKQAELKKLKQQQAQVKAIAEMMQIRELVRDMEKEVKDAAVSP